MLPEHVAMLRQLKANEGKKEMPFLDDQQLEEMNGVIRIAMEEKRVVTATYFENDATKEVTGNIKHFDVATRCIRLVNQEKSFTINLVNIIAIKALDE